MKVDSYLSYKHVVVVDENLMKILLSLVPHVIFAINGNVFLHDSSRKSHEATLLL